MQEKAKNERELRQELDLRRLDQEQNQQMMVTVLPQQQQTNQAILSVIQKLPEKKQWHFSQVWTCKVSVYLFQQNNKYYVNRFLM